MKQINLAEQLSEGTLIALRGYAGIYKVIKHKPTLGELELLNIGNGEPASLNRYSALVALLCVEQPYLKRITLLGDSITPSRYDESSPDIAQLRRDDPSKGEATHYATSRRSWCYQKYHRVLGDTVAFWVTRKGLPGYWEYYPNKDIGFQILDGAIALEVAKYVPTREDFAKALEITRGKHYIRTHKIRDKIKTLELQQHSLNRLYERKLMRVSQLHKDASR